MKYAAESGVYSLRKCLCGDFVFFKDKAPAIPYKEDHFRKFFDVLDDILLSEKTEKRIVGFHVHYPVEERFTLDYGHWEILLVIMLFSLIAARVKDDQNREQFKKYFEFDGSPRFDWESIRKFWQDKICEFKLDDFLKLPDSELSELEKHLRPVAESAWEYTNCIDLSSDEQCLKVIEKLLDNSYFMVVAAPDDESSLQTAASMYGSFVQLMDIRIENLEEGWKIYE